jgi:hypothetical protein
VQFLDRQMPVALSKEEIAERNALTRRPQARATQSGFDSNRRFSRHREGTPVILASINQVSLSHITFAGKRFNSFNGDNGP